MDYDEEQNKEGEAYKSFNLLSLSNIKPNYNVAFHNGERNIGRLDFNGDSMVFEGDAEESAQVFFDLLAKMFTNRLKEERANEREACAKVCDELARVLASVPYEVLSSESASAKSCARKIRARGEG